MCDDKPYHKHYEEAVYSGTWRQNDVRKSSVTSKSHAFSLLVLLLIKGTIMSRCKTQFESDWKTNPFKIRGFHYLFEHGSNIYDVYPQLSKSYRGAFHSFSRKARPHILNNGKLPMGQNAFAQFLIDKYGYICDKYGIGHKRFRRSVAIMVSRGYYGYEVRNHRAPKRTINMDQHKAMHFQDGCFADKNPGEMSGIASIVIPGLNGKKQRRVESEYFIPKNMKLHKERAILDIYNNPKKSQFGGNLWCKKGRIGFTAMSWIPFKWSYEVDFDHVLSFDVNERIDAYLVFNQEITIDGEVLKHLILPPKIHQLIKQIFEANKSIKNSSNTKDRNIHRKRWLKLQAEYRKRCDELAYKIHDYVYSNKMLLVIDGPTPGATSGAFGQEIAKSLQYIFEENTTPFVVCPSYYTSGTCNKCKCYHPDNRKSDSKFECKFCKHKAHADENAAHNIADFGWDIWLHGTSGNRDTNKSRIIDKR